MLQTTQICSLRVLEVRSLIGRAARLLEAPGRIPEISLPFLASRGHILCLMVSSSIFTAMKHFLSFLISALPYIVSLSDSDLPASCLLRPRDYVGLNIQANPPWQDP